MSNNLYTAIQIALKAHKGQYDKRGEIYILHPLRVMLSCEFADDMVVAVLHDVLEDTSTTMTDILQQIDLTPEQIRALADLTRNYHRKETYKEFINRIANSIPMTRRIKILDLEDNCLSWRRGAKELESLVEKRYKPALEILRNTFRRKE